MAIADSTTSTLRQRPQVVTVHGEDSSFLSVSTPRALDNSNAPPTSLDVGAGTSPFTRSTTNSGRYFTSRHTKTQQSTEKRNFPDRVTSKAVLLGFMSMVVFAIIVNIWYAQSNKSLKSSIEEEFRAKTWYQQEYRKAIKAAEDWEHTAVETRDQLIKLQEHERNVKIQLSLMKRRISQDSYAHVVEKYGKGPHRVLFKLNLPLPHNEFVLEMAPLHLMPHSVHVFLQAVEHQVWNDNTFFWINSGHLIQAKSSREKATDANHELYTVSFPEYSHEFDHAPWTVGFAGSPGGPDFYINKRHNGETHGPNTQPHHILPGDADPCFATVVSGFDAVRIISSSQVKDGTVILEQPVRILSARII